ncbi:extracellular matrix regulator RemB [Inediibacterium massiliense]|uniref:extracellular matrix regulator RemB n=1 Tax=Inediibacterium massiliense TaxID=1658111 RepID=UPI0006B5CF46|nr:extracellular matrix/biofilm biosynthesis regulator RemA family protein [Inediibacterium massiliense]
MFLHLGKDIVIPIQNIISIIDADSIQKSKYSKEFFKTAEEEGFVIKISDEKIKSYVITEEVQIKRKGMEKIVKTIIYYSPISSITLQKRSNFIDEIHNSKDSCVNR